MRLKSINLIEFQVYNYNTNLILFVGKSEDNYYKTPVDRE